MLFLKELAKLSEVKAKQSKSKTVTRDQVLSIKKVLSLKLIRFKFKLFKNFFKAN